MNFLAKILFVFLACAVFCGLAVFASPVALGDEGGANPPQSSPTVQEPASPVVELNPSRFELLLEPRGKSVQSLKISNYGKAPITFTADTKDWDLNQSGSPAFFDPAPRDRSASTWIRFNPRQFTVAPGETQYIRFSISVPPSLQPGEYRTSIVLTTVEQYYLQEGFYYKPNFAILIYINIPQVTRKGEFGEVKLITGPDGTRSVQGEIRSTGNAHLRIGGLYQVENAAGTLVKEGELPRKVILPGRLDIFRFDLGKNLAPGKYKVRIIWNYIPAAYLEGKLTEYPAGQKYMVKELSITI